jgi:hypothetical protein
MQNIVRLMCSLSLRMGVALVSVGCANGVDNAERVGSSRQALPDGVIADLRGNATYRVVSPALYENQTYYGVLEGEGNRPGRGVRDAHLHPLLIPVEDEPTLSAGCQEGTSCLAFIGYSWPEPKGLPPSSWNDRLQVVLSSADAANRMRFNEWRYLRFAVNVGADTDVKASGEVVRILDVWQNHRNLTLGAPFTVNLVNGSAPDRATLQFWYRNDVAAPNAPFYTYDVVKGAWNTLYFAMRPRPVVAGGPLGNIQIWVNPALDAGGHPVLSGSGNNSTNGFYWGYNTLGLDATGEGCANGASPCVKPHFEIRAGIYRSNSPGLGMSATWLYLDSLKVTTSGSVL